MLLLLAQKENREESRPLGGKPHRKGNPYLWKRNESTFRIYRSFEGLNQWLTLGFLRHNHSRRRTDDMIAAMGIII
jgi:hypothetical protein